MRRVLSKIKKDPRHYVNNKQFSLAVLEYVESLNTAKEKDEELPIVPNYIAECFIKISDGLGARPNFSRYPFLEEMKNDAVENCLRAISNYNIEAPTRGGSPNAFGYFTLIAWRAFLRRISKEKQEYQGKLKYVSSNGADVFAAMSGDCTQAEMSVLLNHIEKLKSMNDQFLDSN